jgi:hypothetical protein
LKTHSKGNSCFRAKGKTFQEMENSKSENEESKIRNSGSKSKSSEKKKKSVLPEHIQNLWDDHHQK